MIDRNIMSAHLALKEALNPNPTAHRGARGALSPGNPQALRCVKIPALRKIADLSQATSH